MNKSRNIVALAVVLVMGFWATLELRIYANSGGMFGGNPDVIVGSIPSIKRHDTLDGKTSFSIGTTSCNIGDAPLRWIAGSRFHPVISQNLYRVKDGRIEQLGMAWLKHGFLALTGNVCGTCQNPNNGALLGVNCSDPYSASLNGSQNGLGPRSEVNAATGFFLYPYTNLPSPRDDLDGRISVLNSDLDPAQNAGARYYVEAHYIQPDDAVAGNGNNNASYREAFVSTGGGNFDLNTGAPPTVRQQPAIRVWQTLYPDVQLFNVDIPGDGRVIIGIRTTQPKGGGFHSEIAIENLNSHRSVRSLGVKFCSDSITNPGFHDVDYQHEDYSGDDWTPFVNGSEIEWSTDTFDDDADANALRWSTLYSFWCDSANRPSQLTLGLFRPGAIAEIDIDLTTAIPATNLTVFRGNQTGGKLGNAAESDDMYLSFRSGLTAGTAEAPIWLVFDANLPSGSPDFLDLVLESHAATPGQFSTTLEAWNWNTSTYDVVDVSNASTGSDTVVTADLTSGISDYVQLKTGAVRARVGWRIAGLIAGVPWDVRLDQLVWKVNQ